MVEKMSENSVRSTESGSWNGFWISHAQMSEWAKLSWQLSFEFWDDIFSRMAPGKQILECGAGSAKQSQHLVQIGFQATLLDNSIVGLNLGRKAFDRSRFDGKFIVGSVFTLPIRDNSYDAIFSGGLLEHFTDVRPVIKEMVRVLKPGGLFAATIITKRFSCQSLTDYTINFTAKFVKRALTARFKNIIKTSGRNFPFYENSIPVETYRQVMRESGLEQVVVTGTGGFPFFALPRFIDDYVYVPILKALTPLWLWFNCSPSKFTDVWASAWSAYGLKRKQKEE